jgi:FkbM family methyltransferase
LVVCGLPLRSAEHPFGLPVAHQQYHLRYLPKPGDHVLDAGAYDGMLSVLYSRLVGPTGLVIALEPDEANVSLVRANFGLNQVNNVKVLEKVLWSKPGEVSFCSLGTVASSAVCRPDDAKVSAKAATTIDRLTCELRLPRLDFVKMDIEGAEVHALEGARETMARFHPFFAVASYHWVDGKQTRWAVERFFIEAGYRTETVADGRYCITYGWFPGSLQC